MNKIYRFYCLFLFGNLLPFLIIEFYFQDYFTIGLITIIASVVLILCASVEYLKRIFIIQSDNSFKKIDYVNLLQKKELNKRSSFYFFGQLYFSGASQLYVNKNTVFAYCLTRLLQWSRLISSVRII